MSPSVCASASDTALAVTPSPVHQQRPVTIVAEMGLGGSALQLGNFWTQACSASLFESPSVSYSR